MLDIGFSFAVVLLDIGFSFPAVMLDIGFSRTHVSGYVGLDHLRGIDDTVELIFGDIMVSASACVGLTLPGMMDDPGSFSGIRSSAKPARGPHDISRMSFPIL